MRAPLRLLLNVYDYFILYFGLFMLGASCLAWTPIAIVIYPLLSERRGQAIGRFVTMAGFRLYLTSLSLSRRCSFDLTALDALRNEPSLIIAPNHPCLLDALLVISRLPNVACVLKADLMNNIFLGAGARLSRYIRNEPVRRMVQQATHDFSSGSHLLLFPEGTRTTSPPINRLKGSIGLIAHHAKVPVQAVFIETDSVYLTKGWPLFRKPPMPIRYRVRLGRRFDPPQNTHEFVAELERYFTHELVQDAAHDSSDFVPTLVDRTP